MPDLRDALDMSTAAATQDTLSSEQLAAEIVRSSDAELRKVLRAARARGELRKGAELRGLSMALIAILHSLSLRARCGQPARELRLEVVFRREPAFESVSLATLQIENLHGC